MVTAPGSSKPVCAGKAKNPENLLSYRNRYQEERWKTEIVEVTPRVVKGK
jgi:hypothetical protein